MTVYGIRIVNRADVCDTPGSCSEKSNRVDWPHASGQWFNVKKKRPARCTVDRRQFQKRPDDLLTRGSQ
jgi:hypothetical protein